MHVLIVCSHFPPQNETGARRPYYLAQALLAEGHQATVVVCTGLAGGEDWQVSTQGMTVIRPMERWPGEHTPRMQRTLFNVLRGLDKGPVGKVARTLSFLLLPLNHDAHWAVDKARIQDKVDPPDIIVATGPWWGSLILGSDLAAHFDQAKLVLDHRDPWIVLNPKVGLHILTWYGKGIWGKLKRWRAMRLEQKTARNATAVTSVSQACLDNALRSTGLTEGKVIRNGYDATFNHPVTADRPTGEGMIMLYTGRIYDEQPWPTVLTAIERFLDSRPAANGKFKLRILQVGPISSRVLDKLTVLQAKGAVELMAKRSREKTLAEQHSADLLLSLGFDEREGLLPLKNYEYLNARRQVIHYSHADVELEDMIRSTGCGTIHNDPDGFLYQLIAHFDAWCQHGEGTFTPDEQRIAAHSIQARMHEFVEYLGMLRSTGPDQHDLR